MDSKQMDAAKNYWLNYLPLEEMPNLAATICEGYRKNLLTMNEALSAMSCSEKDIKLWIKTNNKIQL
jgi:hypothetical protein